MEVDEGSNLPNVEDPDVQKKKLGKKQKKMTR